MKLNRLAAPFTLKDTNPEEFTFSGIASVFDKEFDTPFGPTVIERGAFTESLRRRGQDGLVLLWQHDDEEPIGRPTAEEIEEGLWVSSRISQTERGKDAITLVRDRVVRDLSIGFNKEKVRQRGKKRHLQEIDLHEISLVTWGAAGHVGANVREVNRERYGRSLGALISRVMEEKELTQDDVAGPAPISGSTVGQIARGNIDCPPLPVLDGIAEGLEIPVSRLVSAAEQDGCEYDEEQKRSFAALRLAKGRLAFHRRQDVYDEMIPVDKIAMLCAPCGEKLRKQGITAVSRKALIEVLETLQFNQGLCRRVGGGDEGFFTRCTGLDWEGIDDVNRFCAGLHTFCIGKPPGAR